MAKKFNLLKVVTSGVLVRPINKSMWTGVVKSENITPYIIDDDKEREVFIRLVKELEDSIRTYRTNYIMKNAVLNAKNKKDLFEESNYLENRILEIASKIGKHLSDPNQETIDTGLYWLQLCRDYEEILATDPEEIKSIETESRRILEDFKNHLATSEPFIREMYIPEENKYVCIPFLTRGQEKKYIRDDKKNSEQLVRVIENIAGKSDVSSEEGLAIVRELAGEITITDLEYVFPNSRFVDMQNTAIFKNCLLKKGFTSENIENMSIEEITEKVGELYADNIEELHKTLVSESIINGIRYIDLERLLLIAMIRPLEFFESMKANYSKRNEANEITEQMSEEHQSEVETEEIIQKTYDLDQMIERTKSVEFMIRKILETNIVSKRTRFHLVFQDKYEEISLKRLEELLQNYCDGIYLTEPMELNLKYEAFMSPDKMSTWSDELVQRIHYNEDNKNTLSMINFENLKRLYRLGIIDNRNIENLLIESGKELEEPQEETRTNSEKLDKLIHKNLEDLLGNLLDANMISAEQLKEYIATGVVTPRMLENLEKNKSDAEKTILYTKLKKSLDKEVLLWGYNGYVENYMELTAFQKEHPEEAEKIQELREKVNNSRREKEARRELFLKYNTGMTEEERHVLGEELLETYYVEMDISDENILQESIKVLYEDGMIDLENIIQLDKKYVIPMLDTLSLDDAEKVRDSMNFDELIEMIDDIFSSEEFSDERKFIIAMNLLGEDSEEDKAARELYLSLLDFDDNSERKSISKHKRSASKLVSNVIKDSNKYIYPDFVKWKFYKALDKEVRVTRYANGFVEFASNKLGCRIIEKYYDGDKPAYGTATYILPEQEYRKNQADLISITPSGNILESAVLREITPRRDRIAHRTQSVDKTWMDEMIKYFGIDYAKGKDTRYSSKELNDLEMIVKRYKTEYEMIQ